MCAGRKKKQCGDPATPDDPINFAINPVPGEPTRLAIASGNYRAAIVIAASPIKVADKGCTISALRLSPKFEIAYITGEGFTPNTEVEFSSHSYDEERRIKEKSDSNGKLRYVLLPFVLGHDSGTTTLVGTAPNCSPKLSFEWGR